MKNFRLNSNKIKSLICTGIMTLTFTGCGHFNKEEKPERQTYKSDIVSTDQIIDTVLVGNQLISVEDVKVVNSKNNSVIENVDGVLVDGKIMNVGSIFDIFYSSDVEAVLVGNELISADDLKLVVSSTNEEISSIDSVLVGDTFIKIPNVVEDKGSNNSSESNSQKDDDYEELTDEKFYELCDSLKKDYQDRGIYFYEEDVEKFVLMSNINRIAVDNRELISDMITTYSIEDITNGANSLISTLVNYNNKVYDDTKSNSGFVLASDAIFDPKEKKTAQKIEGMVNEIGNSMSDNAKMNQLIYELLVGLKESTTDFSQLEDGTKFALCITLRPIREIYGKDDCRVVVTLDHVNAELIKYFVSEFGDENEYYVNGWWTGAYQQVYAVLNENQNCKTLTK